MNQNILLEKNKEKKIASIILNRPEKLNAATVKMLDEINEIVQKLEEDEDVKVIIFKGYGRCFSSGLDLTDLGFAHGFGTGQPGERRPSQRQRLQTDGPHFLGRRAFTQTILCCKKATIAQVHGYCYGSGFQIAMECDVVVAAEDTLFTHPGFRYIGPTTDVWLFLLNAGLKKGKEMMLTGKPMTAREALDAGMINKVVPMEKLEEESWKMAEAMAQLPMDGIVLGKVQFEAALEAMGLGSAYTAAYLLHTLQTNIRYEPGEFNLFRERRNKGIKGAIVSRESYYDSNPLATESEDTG